MEEGDTTSQIVLDNLHYRFLDVISASVYFPADTIEGAGRNCKIE